MYHPDRFTVFFITFGDFVSVVLNSEFLKLSKTVENAYRHIVMDVS